MQWKISFGDQWSLKRYILIKCCSTYWLWTRKKLQEYTPLQQIFLIITSSCFTLKSSIHAYRKWVLFNTEIWSQHWPLLVAPSWFLAPWYPGRWRGGGDSWSLVQPLLCFWSSRRGTTTDRQTDVDKLWQRKKSQHILLAGSKANHIIYLECVTSQHRNVQLNKQTWESIEHQGICIC